MANQDVTATPEELGLTAREKLAKARARQAEREAKAAAEAEAAELERFELVERFERELNGREGREFTIVDVSALGEGFVVVKLGEDVLRKTFAASKMTEADIDAFVVPCVVHPSKEGYRKLVARRGWVADRCVLALSGLFGVKTKEDEKK